MRLRFYLRFGLACLLLVGLLLFLTATLSEDEDGSAGGIEWLPTITFWGSLVVAAVLLLVSIAMALVWGVKRFSSTV